MGKVQMIQLTLKDLQSEIEYPLSVS